MTVFQSCVVIFKFVGPVFKYRWCQCCPLKTGDQCEWCPLLVKTFVSKKLMLEKNFVLYLKAGFSVGVKYSCGEEIEENKY